MIHRKTLKYLLMSCVAFVSATLTSCVDDDFEEEFAVSISGYVLQSNADTVKTFVPYMFISSNSTTFELKDAKIYGDNNNVFEMEPNNEYVYRTTGHDKFYDLTKLQGSYTFIGTAKTGEQASGTFKFNFAATDTLGDLEVLELSRTSSALQAKVKKVANAKYYGFIVTPYSKGESPKRWSNYYRIVAENPIFASDDTFTLSMNFSMYDLATDKAQIQVFVANNRSVYVESEDFRIYDRETDKFQ